MKKLKKGTVPFFVALISISLAACGRKGDPLPPLVRVPVAPADFAAERRGSAVTLHFTVPAANTDGTRPANIERIDVFAYSGPSAVPDDQVMKLGMKVASVDVKRPHDPNIVVRADESNADLEPLEGSGVDQGVTATLHEDLSTAQPPAPTAAGASVGLAGSEPNVRHYLAVGISTRGKRGLWSRRALVPLVPAPPSPAQPRVTYDESSITTAWPSSPVSGTRYHVYEILKPTEEKKETESRLNEAPLTDLRFVDKRMDWGTERCYAVRSVTAADGATVESDASPTTCVTLTDTFPPAAPTGVEPIAAEGAISLIWDSNTEKDLKGYIVLRGRPGESLTPVTPAPIPEHTFRDAVPSGTSYIYAIQAVDMAGNSSPSSTRVEETAR